MRQNQLWTLFGKALTQRLEALERYLESDVISFSGSFFEGLELSVRKKIEDLRTNGKKRKKLYIILTTYGGSARTVERCVHIVRHHYKTVIFIVPDYAYSAGTLFCLSGDRILMDYFSVLGPTDPQVRNTAGGYVPAVGYITKANELIEKTKHEELTKAELVLLRGIDFADLHHYEQAQELAISLAKKWMVEYNLKDVKTSEEKNAVLTNRQKHQFAELVGQKLCDPTKWLSHSRPLNKETLEKHIHLRVDDFGEDEKLSSLIKEYYYELTTIVSPNNNTMFLQTRLDGEIVFPPRKRNPFQTREKGPQKKQQAL